VTNTGPIEVFFSLCRACANAGPILVRELRSESRRSLNFWLRVVAAGAMLLVFASLMLTSQLDASRYENSRPQASE